MSTGKEYAVSSELVAVGFYVLLKTMYGTFIHIKIALLYKRYVLLKATTS
jgi:hypothetical protein